MTPAPHRRALTLTIFPSYRGFGWVAAESPLSLTDWGIAEFKHGDRNAACMRRILRLLHRLNPETVVLEAFWRHTSQRHQRIQRLCQGIMTLARDNMIDVAIYTRGDVQTCFAHYGARTRHQIAEAVARHQEPMRRLLPKPRKAWESEGRNMQLFNAAALTMTHYHVEAGKLLGTLAPGY